MPQIVYEKDKIWSWEEVFIYRIFGVAFFGIFLFLLFFKQYLPKPFPSWCVYLSFLLSIILVTHSKGLYIDARTKTVYLLWNLLGFKQTQKKKFSNFQGIYLRTYFPVSGNVDCYPIEKFELWLMGNDDSLMVYESSSLMEYESAYEDNYEDKKIRKELERIMTLMNLPEIQTPLKKLSRTDKMIATIVIALIVIFLISN